MASKVTEETFLMNFDLYVKYKIFSEIYDYPNYGDSICDIYLGENPESVDNVHSICRKIDNILKNNISSVSSDTSDTGNKYCEYLSYFIYDKIKNLSTNISLAQFYTTLSYAKGIYFLSNDKCNIINFYNNKEYFDKMKELYFRNEILQDIKNKYDNIFIDKKEFCKKYITESADLYNEIVKDNFCKYDEYYKNILTNFLNNFEETKNFLKGKKIEISDVKELSTIPTCESGEKGDTLAEALVSSSHGQQQSVDIPGKLTPEAAPSSISDTGKNSIAGIVSGIFIGTCSLLFIIYKFNPLGSSLPNKIWKTKEKFNIEDKSDEFLLEASDNESMDLYNSMYNIQYHSSQNA
ncbi:PIR Superfamily Protein [Plasmodium ovale wallikeri]|uniref:PIR Superfamily Protein n=1 Tax=Plasmodium ovale wallikeri TaxID=864142 RepID=A0A1A9AFI6_PLAOA|nr:PIR Superfamily Protein [Plasmodium ovale wallikeri]SBT59195.1 PIR Superfamily Protein [Plasmodium ovale wallikeri]